MDRLGSFHTRHRQQLDLAFADIAEAPDTLAEKRRKKRRDDKAVQTDDMFNDWARWFKDTCEMADDPNPYVTIKAVFTA